METETVYSQLQLFSSLDVSASLAHPFSSAHLTAHSSLRSLLAATTHSDATLSVHQQNSTQYSTDKLSSTLRQRTTILNSSLTSRSAVQSTVEQLREYAKSRAVHFGADVPEHGVGDWCVNELQSWGQSVGMEVFRDDSAVDGKDISVLLGGTVLVLDVDFRFSGAEVEEEERSLTVAAVRTSYATTGESGSKTTVSSSASLAGFVSDLLHAFLNAAQVSVDDRDVEKVAKLASDMKSYLRYLMRLDKLAASEGDGGVRWFTALDELAVRLEEKAAGEARQIPGLSSSVAADLFLTRCSSLPLPYLRSPSIDFLTYLPPLAYLALSRGSPPSTSFSNPTGVLPALDIPISALRAALAFASSSNPPSHLNGTVLATLSLANTSSITTHQILTSSKSPSDYTFVTDPSGPEVFTTPHSPTSDLPESHAWALTFVPPVIISQCRMRRIYTVLGLSSTASNIAPQSNSPAVTALGTSWVDLLLKNPSSSEFYTSEYRSPSNKHPALRLRLQNPSEPGFQLQYVPVRSMQDVWGVSQIVREQAWLNTTLQSTTWLPESANVVTKTAIGTDMDANMESVDEADLQADLEALLSGTYTPTSIPVSIVLPHTGGASSTTAASDAGIRMSMPARGSIPGPISIGVSIASGGYGVAVADAAPMGFGVDVDTDVLGEVVRRGAVWSVAGRVWRAMGPK